MNKKLLLATSLLLFLVPFFFWGRYYMVGGDDSRLYYVYPEQYFSNFSTLFVSNNQPGSHGFYFAQSYVMPFALLLSLTKQIIPFVNLQKIAFGSNLVVSFISFYLLSEFLATDIKLKYKKYALIGPSLLYTFSVFSFYTIWNHQLFSVFLTGLFPACIYLFLKSLCEKKITYILYLTLLLFFFSMILYSVPWIVATIITISPVIVYYSLPRIKSFLLFSLTAALLVTGVNFYWIFHMLYGITSSSQQNALVYSVAGKTNIDLNAMSIVQLTRNNSLLYPMLMSFHFSIQKNFSWSTYQIYKDWYKYLLLPNLLFPLLILSAGIQISKEGKKTRYLFFSLLLSWLVSLYFFTAKVGAWGLPLFLFLNQRLPGFTMFRNMYDKFGYGLSLSYALLISMSLLLVIKNIKNKFAASFIICLSIFLCMLNSYPAINGSFFRLPYGNLKNSYNRLHTFNTDYEDLLDYTKNLDPTSRVLWLPINTANYVVIQDSQVGNYYYMGVSPLHFLTQVNDYTGLLSFSPQQSAEITLLLEEKKYQELAQLFQKLNVGYIVINNNINQDIRNSYLFSQDKPGSFYDLQVNSDFFEEIVGSKISSFGDRYDLFEVKSKYFARKIFISDNLESIDVKSSETKFIKQSDYLYKILLDQDLDDNFYLVFLDPFQNGWSLYLDQDLSSQLPVEHEKVFDYANAWKVKKDDLGDSKEIYLYFKPQKYIFPTTIFSLSIVVIVISGIVYYKGLDETH